MFISWLARDPVYFWSIIFSVIVSITLHELAHGLAAIRQGDDTPIRLGHMTWNPIVHMGWVSLFFLLLIGIAWGQMPVSPMRFRGRHGVAWVALAGPASNLILAFLGANLLILGQLLGFPRSAIEFLLLFSILNVGLCLFNLIPLPPLDGATVLGHLDPSYRRLIGRPDLQPVFPFLLVGLIVVLSRVGVSFLEIGAQLVGAYVGLFKSWL